MGVDFLRRNFNVHCVEVEMAYSGYISTLPPLFPLRLVHITPNAFRGLANNPG